MDCSADEFFQIIQEEANKDFPTLDLLFPNEVPTFDKYDVYLPDELVRKEFTDSVLDVAGMKRLVTQMAHDYQQSQSQN